MTQLQNKFDAIDINMAERDSELSEQCKNLKSANVSLLAENSKLRATIDDLN